MTTWLDPKEHPPTPGVEYWWLTSSGETFRQVLDPVWFNEKNKWMSVVMYTEIKPPLPPRQDIERITNDIAEELFNKLDKSGLSDVFYNPEPAKDKILEAFDDLSANIRADEHDRCQDFYVNYDIEKCQNDQHEKTIQAAATLLEDFDAHNTAVKAIKNMEKP